MKIVLAGGTGYLGVLLQDFFGSNHEIIVLSRSKSGKEKNITFLKWDGVTENNEWVHQLLDSDVVINLSGRTVDCRYNEKNKKEILESRINSTEIIGKVLHENDNNIKLWINPSSATIYEYTEVEDMTDESTNIGSGFSVEVCKKWEKSFNKYELPKIRKVALRLSMVMGQQDGPLVPLMNLAKFGLGGAQGKGSQYVSWLSEPDFINIVDYIIKNDSIRGTVNTCSPNPIPNREFMKCIRDAYKMPFGLRLYPWMLEIGAFFIRTEAELVLKSRRVVPTKLINDGFEFTYPDFRKYVFDLVRSNK